MPRPPPRPSSAANGSAAKSLQQPSAAALAALDDEEDDAFIPDADTIRSVFGSSLGMQDLLPRDEVHIFTMIGPFPGEEWCRNGHQPDSDWFAAGEQRKRGSDCALHTWLLTTFL